jgi:ATP-GRASP peptide maturase of grasp-with-spasm system
MTRALVICIFSKSSDNTTTDVMRWLLHLGVADVVRINADNAAEDRIVEFDVDQCSLAFRFDNRTIRLSDIDAVWYRKGRHWLCNQFLSVTFAEHPSFTSYAQKRLRTEEVRLSEYLHFLIENTLPTLGSPGRADPNKLLVLGAAREAGLLVPLFRVTNSRAALRAALTGAPLITKPMSEGFYLFDTEESAVGYYTYTETVNSNLLDELPDRLSPCFIQEQILKKFDVRVFFLDGLCYAMAILSQNDEQTRVDFRQYNRTKPNRAVPYRLPSDVTAKLGRLFERLKLNTGSVDLVVDRQDRFFFLEINPVGVFSMVSEPCNYFLEKQVALTLRQHAARNRSR